MSDDDTVQIDDKALKDFIKALSGSLPVARVGILGSNGARGTADGLTNAEVGASHEFGTSILPMRSFLRMPLTNHLGKALLDAGAFTAVTLREVIRSKTVLPWVQKMAIVGEAVVKEGFATGGYGEWRPSNMAYKTNHQTLVETHQLRDSIASEVTVESDI